MLGDPFRTLFWSRFGAFFSKLEKKRFLTDQAVPQRKLSAIHGPPTARHVTCAALESRILEFIDKKRSRT